MTITLDALPIDVPPTTRSAWGTLASLGLHAGLVALLLIGPNTQRRQPVMPRSIAVEMLSAAQFAALLNPAQAPVATSAAPAPAATSDATSDAKPDAPAKRPSTGTIRATDFYAGNLLAEPASAALRAGMKTLDGSEQLVQICSIEAIEQIRRARPEYDPDTVVAYAMADMAVRNGALIADGAAFRSRREWYELRFSCTAAADYSRVDAFTFSLGNFIPHELWDAHYLTAAESDE